jgi:hypothetical protein
MAFDDLTVTVDLLYVFTAPPSRASSITAHITKAVFITLPWADGTCFHTLTAAVSESSRGAVGW